MATRKIPYFLWDSARGRGRWHPSPELRAKGFKGQLLKDDSGNWLPEFQAMEAAERLNADVKAALEGRAAQQSQPSAERRTVSELVQRFRARAKMSDEAASRGRRLANKTRRDYERYLVMIERWAGEHRAAAITPAMIEDLYHTAIEGHGVASANALMRVAKALFFYGGSKGLRWYAFNPVVGLEMGSIEGRLVLWEPEEIVTLLSVCDWLVSLDQPWAESVGDAIVLAIATGQRAGDLLSMAPLRLERGVYRLTQSKGGRVAFLPNTPLLRARLERMAAFRSTRWANVEFATQIVRQDGQPWPKEGSGFRDAFAAVRALAAGELGAWRDGKASQGVYAPRLLDGITDAVRALGELPPRLRNAPVPFAPMPSIAAKRFQDFRDTAVTWLFDATKDITQVATVTGHSLKTAQTIIDKHYYVRQAEQAIAAGQLIAASARMQKLNG